MLKQTLATFLTTLLWIPRRLDPTVSETQHRFLRRRNSATSAVVGDRCSATKVLRVVASTLSRLHCVLPSASSFSCPREWYRRGADRALGEHVRSEVPGVAVHVHACLRRFFPAEKLQLHIRQVKSKSCLFENSVLTTELSGLSREITVCNQELILQTLSRQFPHWRSVFLDCLVRGLDVEQIQRAGLAIPKFGPFLAKDLLVLRWACGCGFGILI